MRQHQQVKHELAHLFFFLVASRCNTTQIRFFLLRLAGVALGSDLGFMEAYRPHHWFPASNSSGSTSPAHVLFSPFGRPPPRSPRRKISVSSFILPHPPRKRFSTRSHSFLERIFDSFSASCSSCFSLFAGKEFGRGYVEAGRMQMSKSEQKPVDERMLTNVLLAVNVLVYAAQIATQGKLLLWGAKVNSLIRKGQLWRLATSALLHADIGHLMINCYSLNSIGPTVEQHSGSQRFLAIYFSSAIASSFMSYRFSQSPSVGASGAIFGLVGSHAVFVLRHRNLVGGAMEEDLLHVAHVIALNTVIGFLSQGIDNWGHLGGLLGGAASSWFLGPAWQYVSGTADGSAVFADRAPIHQFINRRRL